LAEVLVASAPAEEGAVVRVQDGSASQQSGRTPIFLFDGDWLGGGLYCHSLARMIDTDRPFYKIPPHGVDGGAVPASVQAMAADRVERILETHPQGPFALCGYCAGGLVALEAARILESRGHKVETVILVDSVADAAGDFPVRHLRWRYLAWVEADWKGRAVLFKKTLQERIAPASREEPQAS